jgi:hypothetical protein
MCKVCKNFYTKKYMSSNKWKEIMKKYQQSDKWKAALARWVRKAVTWIDIDYWYIKTLWEDKLSETELVFKIAYKLKGLWKEFRLELTTSFWKPDILIFKDWKPDLLIEVKKRWYSSNKKFNEKQEDRYKEYWNYIVLKWIIEVEKYIESLN